MCVYNNPHHNLVCTIIVTNTTFSYPVQAVLQSTKQSLMSASLQPNGPLECLDDHVERSYFDNDMVSVD